MNNLTLEFEMATGFVRLAMDEFLAHEMRNWTGLLNNYWTIVENEIAGNLLVLFKVHHRKNQGEKFIVISFRFCLGSSSANVSSINYSMWTLWSLVSEIIWEIQSQFRR